MAGGKWQGQLIKRYVVAVGYNVITISSRTGVSVICFDPKTVVHVPSASQEARDDDVNGSHARQPKPLPHTRTCTLYIALSHLHRRN
jgi:hypothetical protein